MQPILLVRLAGGLGNQLFQYAFARHLSVSSHTRLLLDDSGYDRQAAPNTKLGIRQCGLHHFSISGQFITCKHGLKSLFGRTLLKIYEYTDRMKPYHLKRYIVEPQENYFQFDPNVYHRKITSPVIMRGYWQSEKYFAAIADQLRSELILKSEPGAQYAKLARIIQETTSVSVHVRHGDNSSMIAANLGMLPSEYYEKAIANLKREIANPHFFVFSDDISWAKETLKISGTVTFVDQNNEDSSHLDLSLMSLCKHHIVANSTFSWWGAWLGKNEEQIVYAPVRYYLNADIPNPDLYPETWRLI